VALESSACGTPSWRVTSCLMTLIEPGSPVFLVGERDPRSGPTRWSHARLEHATVISNAAVLLATLHVAFGRPVPRRLDRGVGALRLVRC